MIEALKIVARRNKIPIYVGIVSIVFLSNVIPFHLQADDERDVFESTYDDAITTTVANPSEIEHPEDAVGEEIYLDDEIYYEDEEAQEIIIYLRQQFISESSWLFSYPYDDSPMGRIEEEDVWVLEEDGDWLKVLRADQEMKGWMNLSIYPCTVHLDELLSEIAGWGLSVHFENLESGFIYQFNAEMMYPSASVKKAVHGLYIYRQAEEGYIDLNDTLWGVANPNYSIREFVSRNIRVSDDHATFVLLDRFGLMGYLDFIEELGANRNYIGSWIINSQLTVEEASIFARAIYEYMESDGTYSDEFREHLLNNEYPFIVSDYPVASKTGWYPPFAWHDMAIIYAPSPYALIILSARQGWSDRDYEDFRVISMAFQEFNSKWFSFPDNVSENRH